MSEAELLGAIIDEHRKEKLKAEYMVDFYQQEIENPQKIGKEQAEENAALYEKHIKTREEEIIRLEEYGKRKNIF